MNMLRYTFKRARASRAIMLQTGLCQLLPCKATVPQRHVVQCPVAGKPGEAPHKESDATLQIAEGQLGSMQSVMRDVAHEGELQLPALPPMPAGASPCTVAHITNTTWYL